MPPIISKREDLSAFYRKLMTEPLAFQRFLESYAQAFCNQLEFQWGHIQNQAIYLLCGTGLNGQYGLYIAKELARFTSKQIYLYLYNLDQRVPREIEELVEEVRKLEHIKVEECDLSKQLYLPQGVRNNDLLIDSLVGYEQDNAFPMPYLRLFDEVNALQGIKISVEVPSGITFNDEDLSHKTSIIKAKYTYGIALPSLKMFLEAYENFFGSTRVLNVAPYSFEDLSSDFQIIEDDEVISSLKTKNEIQGEVLSFLLGADKASYGHLLLTARTALYAGISNLNLYTNEEACIPLQMQEPELLVHSLNSECAIQTIQEKRSILALSSSPIAEHREEGLTKFFKGLGCPLIIGAKLAFELTSDSNLIQHVPKQSILILSAEDLPRDKCPNQKAILAFVQTLAKQYQINILLLSNRAFICLESGKIYLQGYPNEGSISKSSAELLTGLLLALKSQDSLMPTLELLSLATYIYREASILARQRFNKQRLLAQEITKYIPEVLDSLNN